MEAARGASRPFWEPAAAAKVHPDLVIISTWTVVLLSYQITFPLTKSSIPNCTFASDHWDVVSTSFSKHFQAMTCGLMYQNKT